MNNRTNNTVSTITCEDPQTKIKLTFNLVSDCSKSTSNNKSYKCKKEDQNSPTICYCDSEILSQFT
jgi:hypothetical protein